MWKFALIGVSVLLAMIVITEVIQFFEIDHLNHGEDVYEDEAFHDCKKPLTLVIACFWLTSNILLLLLGCRIGTAQLNANLALYIQEKDSFHRKGKDTMKLIGIRKRQQQKMMFVLYLMLTVSTFSLINRMHKFFSYSADCNPKHIPHWLGSLFDFIDLFVTR